MVFSKSCAFDVEYNIFNLLHYIHMWGNKYIQYYTHNNPKRYWFKRKLFGFGWTPVRWPGVLSTVLYIGLAVWLILRAEANASFDSLATFIVPFAGITIIFFIIAYRTGERPRWQWGVPDDTSSGTSTSDTPVSN